ncbi:MAG: hypothetical protein IPL32_10090 [Chloracidobacterium sp.]|nr:hypothetical protein [Chloracidobacterium sp.]
MAWFSRFDATFRSKKEELATNDTNNTNEAAFLFVFFVLFVAKTVLNIETPSLSACRRWGTGDYRFGNLQVGQTYTIRVEWKSSRFTPITVSVVNQSAKRRYDR